MITEDPIPNKTYWFYSESWQQIVSKHRHCSGIFSCVLIGPSRRRNRPRGMPGKSKTIVSV